MTAISLECFPTGCKRKNTKRSVMVYLIIQLLEPYILSFLCLRRYRRLPGSLSVPWNGGKWNHESYHIPLLSLHSSLFLLSWQSYSFSIGGMDGISLVILSLSKTKYLHCPASVASGCLGVPYFLLKQQKFGFMLGS